MNPQDTPDKSADATERTIETARRYANEALDRADAGVRSLREDVQPAIDALSARVQELAERGKALASQTSAQTREKLNEYSEKTSTYVAQQPLKSMAIAAAAGAALALLLGRRRD